MLRNQNIAVVAVCSLVAGAVAVFAISAGASQKAAESADSGIAVRYAQASLELAKIELERFLEADKHVSRVIPAIVVERARMNVKVAEAQLEQALHPSPGGAMNVQVRYAEERAKFSEIDYDKAKEARRQNPKSMREVEVERLRLVAETARLRLAMWRDPVYLPSLLDQMQWQLDRLSEEIIELNKRIR